MTLQCLESDALVEAQRLLYLELHQRHRRQGHQLCLQVHLLSPPRPR